MKNSGKDRITELEAQLAAAQHKIKELELQKAKLETVLKIAEKEFDIDIEKKSGPKQLHKLDSTFLPLDWPNSVDCLERLDKPGMKPPGIKIGPPTRQQCMHELIIVQEVERIRDSSQIRCPKTLSLRRSDFSCKSYCNYTISK